MNQYLVKAPDTGKRLDVWLTERAKTTRSTVKRWIDGGAVRINGKRVNIAKWAIQGGDRVEVRELKEKRGKAGAAGNSRHQVIVLYEDRDLIAVAKPAGVLSVRTDTSTEESMVEWVRGYLRSKYKMSGGSFVQPVHRLDRETSGILLMAKSREGTGVIEQFKRHAMTREYIAIVAGAVDDEAGTVNIPLAKGDFGSGRKVLPESIAQQDGKRAITHFVVEERYPLATLLRIRVDTGRTHQIRVHMAAIGHPLLGDRQYGVPKDPVPMSRQALHATRLKLRHPVSGSVIDLKLPMPKDFEIALDALRDMV